MANQSAMLKEFLLESFENLSNINEELTRLEKNPKDRELLNQVYRSIHTLKGSASFLGFAQLQDLTHVSESILDHIREGAIEYDSEITDILLSSFDKCAEFLKNIESTGKEGSVEYKDIKEKILKEMEKRLSPEEDPNVQVEKIPGDAQLPDDALNAVVENQGEAIESPEQSVAVEEVTTPAVAEQPVDVKPEEVKAEEEKPEEVKAEEEKPEEVKAEEEKPVGKPVVKKFNKQESDNDNKPQESVSKKNLVDSVVKVNVNLLDKMMNVVGELVLNRNQILQFANKEKSSELLRLTQQLNMITSELQADIMTTRMQPIGSILSKFERLVRDFSRENNKKIQLKIIGHDTELDKTLIEAIRDPLTHIIRNAADHGLEQVNERAEAGKSEEGTITIKAYHESGQVTIEVNDDGKGMDPEKILAKAIEKEIITQDQADRMPEEKVYNLIFSPGFSTAEKITNMSGRGVGMDVVKTNIEKVGGSVNLHSEVGVGSTVKLKIPLTLAIIPALIVSGEKEFFAIPQVNLVELVRFEEGADNIEKIYGSSFFRLRGKLIPIFYIDEALSLKVMKEESVRYCSESEKEQKEDELSEKASKGLNIVILNAEGHTFGLVVDEILDTQEIVVKPLGKNLNGLVSFAGATIMGDGRVALIIDAMGFYNSINIDHQVTASDDNHVIQGKANAQDISENLLFTLGDGREYAIPLAWVNRLEEFDRQRVEWTGSQQVIQYRNSLMPLLNLEKVLQLEGQSSLEDSERKSLSCIVVHAKGNDFGFVVDSIIDINSSESAVNSHVKDRKGLLGTTFIDEKTVTVVDIYSVLKISNITPELWEVNQQYQGKKLLVVEDSPMYRNMEEELFKELGFEVNTAIDGDDAMEKVQAEQFDVIVTDIEMPKLDGFDFTSQLRSISSYQKIPVIAVSTKVSPKDIEKGKKVGFDRHLEKFKKEEIITAIDECLKEAS